MAAHVSSDHVLRELPGLVEAGVVSADVAERIRAHYAAQPPRAARNWALIVFGILGGLMVGLGVILLIAHNWSDLPRAARTALAFLPLLTAQALAAYVVARRRDSLAWREGVGLGWVLAIGACVSLIARTYHLPGDFGDFMLTWTLLALPVVFALRALGPALLFLAGLLTWAIDVQMVGSQALLFWPLTALLVPFFKAEARPDPHAFRPVMLLWGAALVACAALGVTLEKVMPGLWIVVYASLFGVLYLAGGYWGPDAPGFWTRPLHTIGSFGVVIFALMLTCEWPWEDIGWSYMRHSWQYDAHAAVWDYALAVALPAVAVALWVTAVRRGQARRMAYGFLPILATIGFALAGLHDSAGPVHLRKLIPAVQVAFNVFALGIGLLTLVQGFRVRRLSTVNGGLLTVIALVLMRFFDSDVSLVVRGVVFIVLGGLFLAVNVALARRGKGRAAP